MDFASACLDWAIHRGSRCDAIALLMDSYCRFLRAHGINVRRCNLATDTLHPQMAAMRHVWFSERTEPGPINPDVIVQRRQFPIDDALIDETFLKASSRNSPQYLASPFHRIEQDGELHASIAPPGEDQAFPVFHDLAALGCTEYFGLVLRGFTAVRQQLSVAVDNAEPLTRETLENLRLSAHVLTLVLNTLLEHEVKNTIARTYIGRDPGQRVCAGMIELGNVIEVEGAIWYSDLRGFTQLSQELSPAELVAALNSYYSRAVGAIYARGGDVLKYVGDAILAIFPVQALATPQRACAAAFAAALDARTDDNSTVSRAADDCIALHFGVAQYGNIGAADRLDFTLIGKEVNVVARANDIAKKHNEPMVWTRAFGNRFGGAVRSIGSFDAKGLSEPIELLGPRT